MRPDFKIYGSKQERRKAKAERQAARKETPMNDEDRLQVIQEARDRQKANVRQWKAELRQARHQRQENNPLFAQMCDEVVRLYSEALKADLELMKQGKKISLAAKWAPTQGHSHDRFLGLHNRIALQLFPASEFKRTDESDEVYTYRAGARLQKVVLAPLRRYTPVTEVKMCANEWATIE